MPPDGSLYDLHGLELYSSDPAQHPIWKGEDLDGLDPQYKTSQYVLRVLMVSDLFSLGNTFLHSQVLGASVKAFIHRWPVEWEIEQITFAGGNWSTWSILAVGSNRNIYDIKYVQGTVSTIHR